MNCCLYDFVSHFKVVPRNSAEPKLLFNRSHKYVDSEALCYQRDRFVPMVYGPTLPHRKSKPEKFARMIEAHWDGIAAYCQAENKVALGVVEGFNNKIRAIQRRALVSDSL